jgi:putative ABC transport system substrate-binding protein
MSAASTRRRLLLAAAAAAAAPRAWAQPVERKYRVGWIATSSATLREPQALAFVQRLGELGFAEGRNLILDRRHADNRIENFPKVADGMTKVQYDVIFVSGPEVTLAAATKASRDAPIVVVAVDFDPVSTGDVASLAHPGGRVTGITAQQSTLSAKRLELLKETLPNARKIAVLSNEQTHGQLSVVQGTARRLGLDTYIADVKRPPFDLPAAFAGMTQEKCDGLLALGSGLFVPLRSQLVGLAIQYRLPAMFHQSHWAAAGGLMSYGFNFQSMWRRGAEMVAAILRGAKAAETPMETPVSFELALNLKTAATLGITVPQAMLIRADRVFGAT